MLRGQSQPRSQSGRRVLERCKTKANIEIIDVDKDKIVVVIVDAPETSRQGSRVSRASRRNCCPSDVISIDDEEGDTDDTPRNVHGDATSKAFCPASSNSSTSEDAESYECLMSVRNGSFRFKSTEYMRMYPEIGSSRNHFGLGVTSESGTSESDMPKFEPPHQSDNSESDSSDCEIVEDSSGNIREQWERAAFGRKMTERGKFGSEDRASASGSSADPGFLSREATQSTVDLETCINKAFSDHFDEIPPEPNRGNSSNGKENLSFNMSTADKLNESVVRTRESTSNSDPTIDFRHKDSGFQNKEENISKKCSPCAQSTDEILSVNKRSAIQDPEMPVLGPSLGHSILQHDTSVKDDGTSFLDKDEQATVGTSFCTDELHGEFSFQDKEGHFPGKPSPSNPQPSAGKQDSPDSVDFQDKKEHVPGEPSFYTQSQCGSVGNPETVVFQEKEKSVFEELSMSNSQPSDRSHFNVGNDCFYSNREATVREPVCTPHAGSGRTERILSSHTLPKNVSQVLNGLRGERERHKESDEYKRVVEEEWASRERELQIQAEEAQRLRRRRKIENLRLHDMEKRQKQRLEEIRESQKKDEENTLMKEQFRTEIRKELDKMEVRYRDMASLLRGLGIPVEGGPFPMSREVNAAYKQALLRFHPDRASRTNIRQQVEAEETFKLISRLKEKLLPVI